jgi:gelsolin
MSQQLKLEDTNMANHGSKEHRAMRKDAAKKEKAWDNVGKEKGIQIWRIEKFQVKSWPKDHYGEFFSGDSFIILHSMIDEEGKKTYDVFFWLGNQTSQDEAGTAAYKTVELDDLLGDLPVQYREVQGNETKKFLDLFPKMTILEGGVDSGFRVLKPQEYKPRLLHVTGYAQHIQVYQVPIDVQSLNNHDSFVLDAGTKLFQFNGKKSSSWEKRKANAIMDEIQAQRYGKVKESYIIDGLDDKGSPLIEEFWEFFGGRPDSIAEAEASGKKQDKQQKTVLSLHQISNASGVMEVTEVCKGKLDKSKLNSDDAFIVDAGVQLYVWVGKNSNKAELREAMKYATEYLIQQGRNATIPMARVCEGNEPADFWAAFSGNAPGGRAANSEKW